MKQANELKDLLSVSKKVVVVQADNPDGDSLASALALEEILGDLGKDVVLYCGVDIPSYLRYMPGWDRIVADLPKNFDLSIIVDTSSETLLEKLTQSGQRMWLKSKPCVVLDHHQGGQTISFARISFDTNAVATGELIYDLAVHLDWPLSKTAATMLASSIMADSRGLTTDKTSAHSIHVVAELVESGVSIPELETARRATMRRSADLVHYKGVLLQRVEYHSDGKIATITIPWPEIEKYSPSYNPTMLVIEDMLLTDTTQVAIGFKQYPDGKTTAKIRANYGFPVANKLASHFDGGGHPYASGFKVTDGRSHEQVKAEALKVTHELLADI